MVDNINKILDEVTEYNRNDLENLYNKFDELHKKYQKTKNISIKENLSMSLEHTIIFLCIYYESNHTLTDIHLLEKSLEQICSFIELEDLCDKLLALLLRLLLERVIAFSDEIAFVKLLLNVLVTLIKKTNVKQLKVFVETNTFHCSKLCDILPVCGDYTYQMSVMETLYRLCDDQTLKKYVDVFFPENATLQTTFVSIDRRCFESDTRKFLNALNDLHKNVYSILADYVSVDSTELIPPKDNNQNATDKKIWIDFNTKSKSVSIFYDKNTTTFMSEEFITEDDEDSWELIVVDSKNIQNFAYNKEKHYKNSQQCTYYIFTFNLAGIINSTTSTFQRARCLKIFVNSRETFKVLSNEILPNIFEEHGFECETLSSQDTERTRYGKGTIYTPLNLIAASKTAMCKSIASDKKSLLFSHLISITSPSDKDVDHHGDPSEMITLHANHANAEEPVWFGCNVQPNGNITENKTNNKNDEFTMALMDYDDPARTFVHANVKSEEDTETVYVPKDGLKVEVNPESPVFDADGIVYVLSSDSGDQSNDDATSSVTILSGNDVPDEPIWKTNNNDTAGQVDNCGLPKETANLDDNSENELDSPCYSPTLLIHADDDCVKVANDGCNLLKPAKTVVNSNDTEQGADCCLPDKPVSHQVLNITDEIESLLADESMWNDDFANDIVEKGEADCLDAKNIGLDFETNKTGNEVQLVEPMPIAKSAITARDDEASDNEPLDQRLSGKSFKEVHVPPQSQLRDRMMRSIDVLLETYNANETYEFETDKKAKSTSDKQNVNVSLQNINKNLSQLSKDLFDDEDDEQIANELDRRSEEFRLPIDKKPVKDAPTESVKIVGDRNIIQCEDDSTTSSENENIDQLNTEKSNADTYRSVITIASETLTEKTRNVEENVIDDTGNPKQLEKSITVEEIATHRPANEKEPNSDINIKTEESQLSQLSVYSKVTITLDETQVTNIDQIEPVKTNVNIKKSIVFIERLSNAVLDNYLKKGKSFEYVIEQKSPEKEAEKASINVENEKSSCEQYDLDENFSTMIDDTVIRNCIDALETKILEETTTNANETAVNNKTAVSQDTNRRRSDGIKVLQNIIVNDTRLSITQNTVNEPISNDNNLNISSAPQNNKNHISLTKHERKEISPIEDKSTATKTTTTQKENTIPNELTECEVDVNKAESWSTNRLKDKRTVNVIAEVYGTTSNKASNNDHHRHLKTDLKTKQISKTQEIDNERIEVVVSDENNEINSKIMDKSEIVLESIPKTVKDNKKAVPESADKTESRREDKIAKESLVNRNQKKNETKLQNVNVDELPAKEKDDDRTIPGFTINGNERQLQVEAKESIRRTGDDDRIISFSKVGVVEETNDVDIADSQVVRSTPKKAKLQDVDGIKRNDKGKSMADAADKGNDYSTTFPNKKVANDQWKRFKESADNRWKKPRIPNTGNTSSMGKSKKRKLYDPPKMDFDDTSFGSKRSRVTSTTSSKRSTSHCTMTRNDLLFGASTLQLSNSTHLANRLPSRITRTTKTKKRSLCVPKQVTKKTNKTKDAVFDKELLVDEGLNIDALDNGNGGDDMIYNSFIDKLPVNASKLESVNATITAIDTEAKCKDDPPKLLNPKKQDQVERTNLDDRNQLQLCIQMLKNFISVMRPLNVQQETEKFLSSLENLCRKYEQTSTQSKRS